MASSEDPLQSFVNKWGEVPQGTPEQETLRSIDEQRVAVGKRPLTASQTQRAIQAATTRQPVTPMPERDPTAFWKNATDDITELVKGIPQLPMALVNEVMSFGNAPTRDVKGVGDIFEMPIIRLLPGAFTASAVLPGGAPISELAIRPVSTALDVLPFASAGVNSLGARALRNLPEATPIAGTTRGTVGSVPSAREFGTLASSKAVEGFLRENVQPLPLVDRVGLIAAQAKGSGLSPIPTIVTKTIEATPEGSLLLDRAWRRSMARTGAGQKALQFSQGVRNMRSSVARNEANLIIEARRNDAYVAGARLEEDFTAAFPDADARNNAWEELSRAFDDPDSFSDQAGFKIKSPEEARDFLADEVKPFFDQVQTSVELLQAQTLLPAATTGRDALVRLYRGDQNIYTIDEWKKLTDADQRLATARSVVSDKLIKPVDRIRSQLEQRFPGAVDARKAGMTVGGAAGRAADQFIELEKIVAGHIDGTYMQSWKTTAKSDLPINANDAAAIFDGLAAAKKATKRRNDLSVRIRPATEMRTGSRIFYQRAMENMQEAIRRSADPDFQAYRAAYENRLNLDPAARSQLTRQLRQQMGDEFYLLRYSTPDVPNFIRYYTDELERQNLRTLIEPAEIARLQQQVNKTLYSMAGEGYRPAWLPGVAMERAANVDSTSTRLTYFSPDYAKRRSFDYAPMNPSIGINISYASLQDYMSRTAVPYITDQIKSFGMTGVELQKMLQAEALSKASRVRPDQVGAFITEYVNDAMGMGSNPRTARFVQYDPKKLWPTLKDSPTASALETVWLPKEMESVIVQSFKDSNSFFQQLFEPVTDTFRMSVLLFAPAWHFNNIMSNSLITGLTNPKAFLNIVDEWNRMGGWGNFKKQVTQAKSAAGGIEESLRGVGQIYSPQMKRVGFEGMLGAIENMTINISAKKGKAAIENSIARFKTGNRVLNEIQSSKGVDAARSAFGRMTGGSLALNAWFDDLFRRANFEAFYDTEFKRLSDENIWSKDVIEQKAAEFALRNTQSWLMDWSQMLPVERGILRAVFPFYSFMSHILRAAIKYPFDHPVRVAIINAFTRAEIEDWQSRYPQIFRRLLGVPNVDEVDSWKAMNVDSFNPFRDVGNLFTMGGMLTSTNPLIQFVFKSVGVDPMSAGPEYAPNFVYDPLEPSGKTYDSGNPIINLAKDIVPQLDVLGKWMGLDADFRELEASNPAAAQRAILTGLRIPIVFREINVNELLAKEEIKRFDDYRKAASAMDVDRLARYSPELAELAESMAEKEQSIADAAGAAPQLQLPRDPRALSRIVSRGNGGPPSNPISDFVTV
jgi:hypothetical protein